MTGKIKDNKCDAEIEDNINNVFDLHNFCKNNKNKDKTKQQNQPSC